MSASADAQLAHIKDKEYIVGIIGLGYVGVPLSFAAVRGGFRVIGFDIDAGRVALLKSGRSSFRHIPDSEIADGVDSGRLDITNDFTRLGEPDAILIAVPTPLTKHREPDLSYVEKTAEAILPHLRKGQLIVLESTTWPGTTLEIIKPILERSGLKSGIDFWLAFSPEREDPGNDRYGTASIPKVVGGEGEDALAIADALYKGLVVDTVPVRSTSVAEAVKLTENIFRSVNIALVNELKVIYEAMGIDVWEVIDAAKTKPFGFMPFYPGPGLGGHCIPIDPFYLTWKAREFGISTRFIELAGEINTAMPAHIILRLAEALDRHAGKGLSGSRILVVGAAYKKNIDDIRESPALVLIELLQKRGARAEFHDPHVAEIPKTREHMSLTGMRSQPIDADSLKQYDAVLIATDHDAVDFAQLSANARLVVDTRNACARAGVVSDNVVKA